MVLEFVPLLVVSLPLLVVLGAPLSARLDLIITQLALGLFGSYTKARKSINTRQVQTLEAAHVGDTYRVYASKTFLYATLVALVGSVAGVYLFVWARSLLLVTDIPEQIPWLLGFIRTEPANMSLLQLFGLLIASSATIGVLGAFSTYQMRWSMLRYAANERERRIDATLKRNVAFVFALSRSGMPFPDVIRTLSRHTGVYGETAREVRVTVKDLDIFGTDLLSALRRTGDRTPSEELEDFMENLGSVLRSGRSIPSFLKDQYDYFEDEESAQQEQFLELLGTLAEAYVTVFVAGPLFLITILVVIGLLLGGTLSFLQTLVYLILPLSTVGFVIYLDSITEDIQETPEADLSAESAGTFTDIRIQETDRPALTDGGTASHAKNWYRLSIYRQTKPYLRRLRDPMRLIAEEPVAVLFVTVPLGIIWVALGWWGPLTAGVFELAAYDDALIQAVLFVSGTFAVTYEISQRRIKAVEANVPDFLDRLAATNEAGMAIVDSFDRVVQSDLGALSTELRRTWADIKWGAHVENALLRFQMRVQTPAITRVVTLTTNAMKATNDIGPVLRIAADEAKSTQRLERDRRNELLTYMVVVYIAFFVFLVVIVALDTVFIPSIPTGEEFAGNASTTGGATGLGVGSNLQSLTQAKKDLYSLLFFHAGIVQGFVSGFVAGQMGEGSIKAGAKHGTIMLGIAYVVFIAFG